MEKQKVYQTTNQVAYAAFQYASTYPKKHVAASSPSWIYGFYELGVVWNALGPLGLSQASFYYRIGRNLMIRNVDFGNLLSSY